jgi:hypothetical protein
MLEDSWPVSMKITLSVKMAENSFVVLRIIFQYARFTKKQGACVDIQNWQKPTRARQAG